MQVTDCNLKILIEDGQYSQLARELLKSSPIVTSELLTSLPPREQLAVHKAMKMQFAVAHIRG